MYPPLNPILVQLGPVAIHWYGVIMTLAIFLGAWTASRFVSRHGSDGNVDLGYAPMGIDPGTYRRPALFCVYSESTWTRWH